MAIEIPNELINNLGFAALIVAAVYMLFAYGEAIRNTRHIGAGITTKYVYGAVTGDMRKLAVAVFSAFAVTLGWTLDIFNLGAAVGGLTNWAGPVWFWFVEMLLSVANVFGITDFNIVQVVAFGLLFGVMAIIIRRLGYQQ